MLDIRVLGSFEIRTNFVSGYPMAIRYDSGVWMLTMFLWVNQNQHRQPIFGLK